MKRLLTAIFAILLTVNANAQFGIVGGITTASTRLKDVDVRGVTDYHAGIAYKVPLVLGFVFQPELLYNVKGGTVGEIVRTMDMKTFDFAASYLELGTQLQWGPNFEVARPYAFAEPFVGFAFKMEGSLNGWSGVNRFEYGVGFGFGVEVINHVQVAVKYFWNLGPLFNENGEFEAGNEVERVATRAINDGYADGIQISAAIIF